MMAERVDPETLAALLDGKLDQSERARVLRILAENPEEYEAFADAAHIATRLADADPAIVPIESARRSHRALWIAIPALVAAGIAVIVVLPRTREKLLPVELAAGLSPGGASGPGSLTRRLGQDWDEPGWSVQRGPGSELDETSRAFRLGARATDVEIAFRTRDTLALGSVGEDLMALVTGIEGGSPTLEQYRSLIAKGDGAGEPDRRAVASQLRSLVGKSPWFDLGAWTEAARVAAVAGDTAFLAGSRTELDDLATKLKPTDAKGTSLALVRELRVALDAPGNLAVIRDLVARVVRAAGR